MIFSIQTDNWFFFCCTRGLEKQALKENVWADILKNSELAFSFEKHEQTTNQRMKQWGE